MVSKTARVNSIGMTAVPSMETLSTTTSKGKASSAGKTVGVRKGVGYQIKLRGRGCLRGLMGESKKVTTRMTRNTGKASSTGRTGASRSVTGKMVSNTERVSCGKTTRWSKGSG